MRSLSETLLEAQKGRAARPCVRVTVDDRHIGVGRLRLAAVYAGEEGEGPCAIAACDGYVLRAWVNASGQLWLCRTAAGAGSGWGAWSLLAEGVSTVSQVALAAGGGCAFLLYVSSDGATLTARRSADAGVTWMEAETVFQAEAGSRIPSLAAVHGTAHDCICVFVVDGETPEADDVVHVAWFRMAEWTAAAWPRDPGDNARGIAAVVQAGDTSYSAVSFVLCGCFEDVTRPAARLYYLQLTAAGQRVWIYRGPILVGDAADFTWSWPSLVAGDGDRPRLFLLENTPSGTRLGHVFLQRLGSSGPVSASDLTPLQWQSACGAGATTYGQALYLGCAAWVVRSDLYAGASGQRLDVSEDVVAYEGRTSLRGSGSSRGEQFALLLDNSGGRYDAASALRLSGQLCLREGYRTVLGEEVICQAPYWIGEIERSMQRGPVPGGQVLLRCYDGWAKLGRGLSDRAREWFCSPALLLAEALERLGFVYSDDGSVSLYSSLTPPRFTLAVGQSWGGLVERVLDYCGCELRFYVDADEEGGWPSARAHVFTPDGDSVYSFGPMQHPAKEAALIEREAPGMWVQVYGDGVFGEALDDTAMAALGFAATRQAFDLRLNEDTDVTAAQAAGFLLQRYGRERRDGWLVARPNVGQELADVVTVQVGSTAEERLVVGIERRYDRMRGVYEHRLLLGGV